MGLFFSLFTILTIFSSLFFSRFSFPFFSFPFISLFPPFCSFLFFFLLSFPQRLTFFVLLFSVFFSSSLSSSFSSFLIFLLFPQLLLLLLLLPLLLLLLLVSAFSVFSLFPPFYIPFFKQKPRVIFPFSSYTTFLLTCRHDRGHFDDVLCLHHLGLFLRRIGGGCFGSRQIRTFRAQKTHYRQLSLAQRVGHSRWLAAFHHRRRVTGNRRPICWSGGMLLGF